MNEQPPPHSVNRELSWLAFDRRVLGLADEPGIPLLERAKFCAIGSSNLDEFYLVHVAALRDQVAAGLDKATRDGHTPLQQLERDLRRSSTTSIDRQESIYLDQLRPALTAEGDLRVVGGTSSPPATGPRFALYYEERIFPVLTPLAVDPGHPFPYISNLALSIAAHVADPDTAERRFVRLKIPDVSHGLWLSGTAASCPPKT